MSKERENTGLEIAIIGMSGRFPGASSVSEFWQQLINDQEMVRNYSTEELTEEGFSKEYLSENNFIGSVGKLENPEWFDGSYFGFSHMESEVMDPQIRIMLECAQEALQDAGYNSLDYKGYIGVYTGASSNELWEAKTILSGKEANLGQFETEFLKNKDFISAHLSYRLNLKGPSFSTFTACSTSLTTVHLACQALLNGECDMALAGGVSVNLVESYGYSYQEGMILSKDGHCKPFDKDSSGTISSDGAGIVLLKPLDTALRDGDHIYATILASAINNDGNDKIGFTAPSLSGQVDLMKTTCQLAEVDPESISYVEAHGTATSLGDSIEFEALKQAFSTEKRQFCALGAVKSNVGHMDAAAGIGGLIKVALSLKHKKIPGTVHYTEPNEWCHLEESPFYLTAQTSEWKNNEEPRRAAVSSLGIGGSNAYLILEEAESSTLPATAEQPELLVLSAKTRTALSNMITQHATHNFDATTTLRDTAFTLGYGRQSFPWRHTIHASNLSDAKQKWSSQVSEDFSPALDNPKLVYLVSGQGTQYSGMYAGLYESSEVFKNTLNHCLSYLPEEKRSRLHALIFQEGNDEALRETENSQLALFTCTYSLAHVLLAEGIRPDAMIGHSIGEFVCACISGVISLQDAIELVELRGHLMQQMPKGKMLSIGLPLAKVTPLLTEGISLAAVNADELCVVSGNQQEIDQLATELNKQGVFIKELHTSHAFHSYMMDDALPAFQEKLNRIVQEKQSIPYLSNVTGNWISDQDLADKTYWSKHLRNEVRFHDGINTLLENTATVFVEIGPGNALCQLVKSNQLFGAQHRTISLVRRKNEAGSDAEFLLQQFGKLWETGYSIPMEKLVEKKGNRVPLPTYPFERERYWIDGSLMDWIQPKAVDSSSLLPTEQWTNKSYWKRIDGFSLHQEKKNTSIILIDLHNSMATEEIASKIESQVLRVTLEENTPTDQSEYYVSAKRKESFTDLFQRLKSENITFNRVVISIPHYSQSEAGVLTAIQTQQFLMYLADGLSSSFHDKEITLDLITDNQFDVIGNEAISELRALAMGMHPVISQEYGNIKVNLTDFDQLSDYSANQVSTWITAGNRPSEIAVRKGQLWNKSYELHTIDLTKHWNVTPQDVYVITGGMGNVGLKLAASFAEAGACTIYLIGRTLPADDSNRFQQINALRKNGVTVELRTADVCDKAAFHAVLDDIYQSTGTITGVVHAAANMVNCIQLIGTLTAGEIQRIVSPKVLGAMHLSEWSTDKTIGFIALTSSISTELGGLGYGSYAASNAYLDALALNRKESPTRWLTINWDGWQLDEQIPLAITETEGKSLFQAILGQLSGQTIVSTTSFDARRKQWIQEQAQPSVAAYTEIKKHKRPELITPYVAPSTPLEKEITEIWENFFRIESIGIHDDFFALGGDSLKGMILVNRYKELLGEIIYVSIIFEATTIEQTANYFRKHYAQKAAKIDGIESIETNAGGSTISTEKVAEIKQLLPLIEPDTSGEKNKKAVFVISSSRSGSTLLRVMLAGNPALFAPPELELMNYHSMEGQPENYQGLIRSLMAIFGWDAAAASEQVEQMIRENWSVKKVYQYLQQAIPNQLLVEKTPSYSFNKSILERIDAEFDEPLFIHLVRHPYGMINSKKNARLDLLRGELETYFQSGQELAEFEWVLANQNCEEFLETIGSHRFIQVKYEDLVTQPEETAKAIAETIGIHFHPAMLEPYADQATRMTDGVHEQSIMIGDPKFHTHRSITSDNADAWRNDIGTDFLHEDTLAYAKSFGYASISELNQRDWEKCVSTNRYPVSSQQRKLLIYQDIYSDTTNYNIPRAIKVGPLDRKEIQRAVDRLTERHSMLRTSFIRESGHYYQQIASSVDTTVEWTTLTDNQDERSLLQSLVTPFNVEKAPLFRVHVIDRKNGENVIFFDTHHILTDAISQNLLISELIALYEEKALHPIEATYHEYAAYENSPSYRFKLKQQREFWLSAFSGSLPKLTLETDHKRPELLSFEGAEVMLAIEDNAHHLFETALTEIGVSRYVMAFSIYQLFLKKLTGQDDIIVGTPVTRRPEKRFESTVGMFVNTLPVRTYPESDKTISDFILDMKRTIIDVFKNGDFSLDDLIGGLDLERDFSRNPLFDSMFVFQNFDSAEQSTPSNSVLEFVPFGEKISRYDLSCVMFDFKDAINVHFEYRTGLFTNERITDYSRYFSEVWNYCMQNTGNTIESIPNFYSSNMQSFTDNNTQGLEIEFNF